MRWLGFFCLALAAVAHAWLLIEVDPMASSCQGLVYETIAVVVVDALILFLGCCGICRSLLVPLSAVVVIFASRLSLYVESSRRICVADVAGAASTNILKSDSVYDRAMIASWSGLVLFGLGLLLMHIDTALFGIFDCFSCLTSSKDSCDDPCETAPILSCDDCGKPICQGQEKSKKVWVQIQRT